jgi:peptidyl-prolyl cis-trans isomerase C
MAEDKSQNKTEKTAGSESESQCGKSGTTKFIAIVAVVAVVAVIGFALSKNGVAESDNTGVELSDIAPASANAAGDDTDAPMIKLGNPVVAEVNGDEIKRSDVFNFISGLPDQVRQMPIQNLFPLALEQVVNNRLISNKAKGSNLAGDPEVEQLVSQAEGQIIRNVFIDRQVTEALTQKRLLKAYEELIDTVSNIEEVSARHILITPSGEGEEAVAEAEAKAKDVIAKLDEGGDFAELAKEHSMGPTAENGGDLGFFAKNQMVPEFAEAAFALDVNTYTKSPVKTQFGWHVVKVEEKRMRPEPKFEEVKPQLEAQLRQQVLAELLENWQKEAKIKKFDINGEDIKQN